MTSLVLAALLMGQKPDSVDRGTDNDKAAAEERLKFMKESVETYRLTLSDDRETPLRLEGKPAFRLGKQSADNVVDGAIFFWIGVGGRPETAIQAFMIKDSYYPQGLWIHEFTSLAPGALTAQRGKRSVWAPTTGGVDFKPIPGAPKPAATLAQRTRQLNTLAQGFRASDQFKKRGWSE